MTEVELWKRVAAKATLLLARTNYPDLGEVELEVKASKLLVGFVDVERSMR